MLATPRKELSIVLDREPDQKKGLDLSGPASGARSAAGRPARTTVDPITAGTCGMRSRRKEFAHHASISGLQRGVSRVPGGRHIPIGMCGNESIRRMRFGAALRLRENSKG
jgi:hypothetical protein